jgi:hypothetical protein
MAAPSMTAPAIRAAAPALCPLLRLLLPLLLLLLQLRHRRVLCLWLVLLAVPLRTP